MVIRINIAAAFEGGIPLTERRHLTDPVSDPKPEQRFTPTPLDPEKVDDLQKKIFKEIKSTLVPSGLPSLSLHPVLEAALMQDVKSLAPYLLRSCGDEFRCLLDLKSILCLGFSAIAELPSSHYEPVLISKGCDPVLARGLAQLVIRMGRQIAEVAKCRRDVVEAIRAFSKPTSRGKIIIKKAAFLLDASHKCSAVETIFYELNMSPEEFIGLLRSIVGGYEVDRKRLAEIVTEITPVLKTPSGRKPCAASVAHEFLLHHMRCGYTWDVDDEDFSDSFTQATRLEFGDPKFSPRSARRRMNARQYQMV